MRTHSSRTIQEPTLVWGVQIPILTNPFMLWDLFRVFGLVFVIFFVFMYLITQGIDLDQLLSIVGMIMGIIFGLFRFAGLLIYWNGIDACFEITEKGAGYKAGKKAKRMNKIVLLLGLLAGSARVAGAGLLATSQEEQFFPWRQIHKATIHKRWRVISLSNNWRTVIRLYCTPENFDDAERLVRQYMAGRPEAVFYSSV